MSHKCTITHIGTVDDDGVRGWAFDCSDLHPFHRTGAVDATGGIIVRIAGYTVDELRQIADAQAVLSTIAVLPEARHNTWRNRSPMRLKLLALVGRFL